MCGEEESRSPRSVIFLPRRPDHIWRHRHEDTQLLRPTSGGERALQAFDALPKAASELLLQAPCSAPCCAICPSDRQMCGEEGSRSRCSAVFSPKRPVHIWRHQREDSQFLHLTSGVARGPSGRRGGGEATSGAARGGGEGEALPDYFLCVQLLAKCPLRHIAAVGRRRLFAHRARLLPLIPEPCRASSGSKGE